MLRLPFFPPVTPFLFSALVVGGLTSKVLHLALHFNSLPFLYFVLYSPTLVLPDVLVIICGRWLLQYPAPETRWQWISTAIGAFLSLATWGACSIQIGFFMQTGAEVSWSASNSFISDPAAMKILLSGISTVSAAGTVLGLVAWLIHSQLYHWTGIGLHSLREVCLGGLRAPQTLPSTIRSLSAKPRIPAIDPRSLRRLLPVTAACVSLLFLELTRPSVPYDHLSGALPVTLLDAFHSKANVAKGCRTPSLPFPLWEEDSTASFHHIVKPEDGEEEWIRPAWLPLNPGPGFRRLDTSPADLREADNHYAYVCNGDEGGYYYPEKDPLKISNLDGHMYEPLQKAFQDHPVEIEHIIVLTLESGRKDMFPVQQGTPLFDGLLASHKVANYDAAIDRLVGATPVAQMLTGEYATDSKGKLADLSNATWQDTAAEGMGGINVRGAVTGSSLTFKSFLNSHCGVNPLPVDLLEESLLEIYQPCLPQILELFNELKNRGNKTLTPEPFSNPWKSVFLQSITDDYDRQDILNDHIGFKHKVVKKTLEAKNAKHKPDGEEINYFGYAETELRPYIQDLIDEAVQNHTRLFLSHVTSTTHHPWSTPENFTKVPYVADQGNINHDLMNNYLNAARFVDNWIGDILGMLDEAGIANQTLVVVVGDHGQAFGEDDRDHTGTYNNGHISNYRVPLVFRHPQMPRVDIAANATALSILPTILDLLVQTKSLPANDAAIAASLLPEYQGQSLLRPFLSSIEEPPHHHPDTDYIPEGTNPHFGEEVNTTGSTSSHIKRSSDERGSHRKGPLRRSVWNMGMVNAGGAMMAVSAADVPYRLILPMKEDFEYRFTDVGVDPGEKEPISSWSLDDLVEDVYDKHGEDAAAWLQDAEKVGVWYINEQKRIWGWRDA
ncbi:Alkaline phosphatase-like alpha/beta/alpha [Penicillium riverlandense]|uniref:Alkaline phosphatase-like alpha/beta/alpha n=1 Tax=Penicillium riverlandense TaxID=1903569 RepID=UPI002548C66A|nr:Alkaline phosphatase-like alpha/beta/alpha [Penicillium riverlandense]KAJ5812001.1 Alkaline phosphatase-like alpha/beta/alpha [Penicillium riverlandense]